MIVLVAIAGMAGVLWQWGQARRQRDRAREANVLARAAEKAATRQLVELSASSGLAASRQQEHAKALLWF
ncbi:hypothetical protein, partial [Escherichia coli]|uniref:hypothetical protein n=1 Tax=Escherichia coli TaxID=562 RepID=UPI002119D5A7